jgi:hypothetical protein
MLEIFARSAGGATASGSGTGSAPTVCSEGDASAFGLLGSKDENDASARQLRDLLCCICVLFL